MSNGVYYAETFVQRWPRIYAQKKMPTLSVALDLHGSVKDTGSIDMRHIQV